MMIRRLLFGLFAVLFTASAFAQSETGAGPSMDGTGFGADAPHQATLWRDGDPGQRLMLTGRVLDAAGQPLAGAVVNVWQADGAGSYHPDAYRAVLITDAQGKYALRTAVPGNYAGVKHIHMQVNHSDHGVTGARIVFKGDPYLSEREQSEAVILEETRVKDEVVYVGAYDVVMPAR